jgi:hypothetical protein
MMSGDEVKAAKLLAVLGPSRENRTMIRVVIVADLNDEDETGFV